jgi:NADH dehydrogenase (ubiquinone) 1 alpha subcomplex subunit 9
VKRLTLPEPDIPPTAYPLLWHVNGMKTKMRPVHSFDVAEALEVMMDAENTSIGKTFSLGGPKTYTVVELLRLVEALTFNKTVREGLNIPKFALMAAAKVGDLAWWPMLSPDEVTRRYLDDKADEPGECSIVTTDF